MLLTLLDDAILLSFFNRNEAINPENLIDGRKPSIDGQIERSRLFRFDHGLTSYGPTSYGF